MVTPADLADPAGAWRAILLRDTPFDSELLEVLRADPSVEVHDALAGLRAELQAVRGMDGGAHHEPPVWVYYPWRRRLVHLLGPIGFRAVRLDRNRNKITTAEQQAFSRARIGVIGLSVGHAIAHTLALEGLCGELRLCDFDRLELSNLNRIPATVMDLGVNKAVVAARRIAEIDPYLDVQVHADGLTQDNIADVVDGLDLVIEECDSLDMKLAVRQAARERHVPVIMETSDRGLLDVERFDIEPDRPPFHGLLGHITGAELAGLPMREKVPYALAILDPPELSARMAASIAEIDQTVSTWPQLGGDVTLGAATVAAVVRRLLRGDPVASGRTRIDLDQAIHALRAPPPPMVVGEGERVEVEEPPADPREAIVHAATLAPSGGNAQPWQITMHDTRMQLTIAPQRTSRMDVHFRGSAVALGAALMNARVVAAERHILGPYEVGIGSQDLPVATLAFGSGTDPDLAALGRAVWTRRTNRGTAEPAGLGDALVRALERSAAAEGGRLRIFVDPAHRSEIGGLLGAADRMRYLDPTLHAEMMGELRWPGEDMALGLDVRTLQLDRGDLAKLAVARRPDVMALLAAWGTGNALGEPTRDRVRDSSAVLVVTVPGHELVDYVRGGMALERVWLTAEHHGLGLQPVSPVFVYARDQADDAALVAAAEAPALRHLAEAFSATTGIERQESLVLVLRLTHAPSPAVRSRRLPLDAVVHRGH